MVDMAYTRPLHTAPKGYISHRVLYVINVTPVAMGVDSWSNTIMAERDKY